MAEYIEKEAALEIAAEQSNDWLYDAINAIPAANVRENVKGEWIWAEAEEGEYEQYWVCSVCGEHNFYQARFCPDCGTEMTNLAETSQEPRNEFAKYDPDEFFSAERYPLPMKCSECGKTMRPVHKHCTPDMPRTYFCTFCGAGFYEDNPSVRFNMPQTNADRIRGMSDEELAEYLSDTEYASYETGVWGSQKNWLDWLQQEAAE